MTLEEMPDIKTVAALRKGLEGQIAPSVGLMKVDGQTLNHKESIELLSATHFVGSSTKRLKDRRTSKKKVVDLNDKQADFITIDKFKAAINSFKSFKGPGPDLLPL